MIVLIRNFLLSIHLDRKLEVRNMSPDTESGNISFSFYQTSQPLRRPAVLIGPLLKIYLPDECGPVSAKAGATNPVALLGKEKAR